jgi:hypothetical protein
VLIHQNVRHVFLIIDAQHLKRTFPKAAAMAPDLFTRSAYTGGKVDCQHYETGFVKLGMFDEWLAEVLVLLIQTRRTSRSYERLAILLLSSR